MVTVKYLHLVHSVVYYITLGQKQLISNSLTSLNSALHVIETWLQTPALLSTQICVCINIEICSDENFSVYVDDLVNHLMKSFICLDTVFEF